MDPPVFAENLKLPGGVWRLLAATFALLEFITYEIGFLVTCFILNNHGSHMKCCGKYGNDCYFVVPLGVQIFDASLFLLILASDVMVFISIGNEDRFLLHRAIQIHYVVALIDIVRIFGRALLELWKKVVVVVVELAIQSLCIGVFMCYYWDILRARLLY